MYFTRVAQPYVMCQQQLSSYKYKWWYLKGSKIYLIVLLNNFSSNFSPKPRQSKILYNDDT